MYLVASSSPPSSPPPPCGDEKEEDSAEEEEADGGGGAPGDLGWAGAGRGGPGTAPLEPRDLGILRSGRARSADQCFPPRASAGPAPRTRPYLSDRVRIPVGAAATRPREKGTSPTPLGARRTPTPTPTEPTPGDGAGTPGRRRGFAFSSPVSPKELKMAENVVEPGPPSAKRPKLSSPALSASASDGTG